MNRKITITRNKRFMGWVITYYIMIDNQIYAKVSNGKTVEFIIDTSEHKLLLFGDFSDTNGGKMRITSNELIVPSGDKEYRYTIDTKASLFGKNQLVLVEENL